RVLSLRRLLISSLYPGSAPSWGALYSSECLARMSEALKKPSRVPAPSTTAPRPSAKRSGGAPLCLTETLALPSDRVKERSRLLGSHLSEPGSTRPPRRYVLLATGAARSSLGVTK